jgi:hypothetical protein
MSSKRQDRAQIKEEWIEFVIENPEKTVIQSDGRIRRWSKITEANKYLRVILLEDGVTVHNAFFDRSYNGSANCLTTKWGNKKGRQIY